MGPLSATLIQRLASITTPKVLRGPVTPVAQRSTHEPFRAGPTQGVRITYRPRRDVTVSLTIKTTIEPNSNLSETQRVVTRTQAGLTTLEATRALKIGDRELPATPFVPSGPFWK